MKDGLRVCACENSLQVGTARRQQRKNRGTADSNLWIEIQHIQALAKGGGPFSHVRKDIHKQGDV